MSKSAKDAIEIYARVLGKSAKGKIADDIVDENGCIQTLPHKHIMDGAFAAKLVRIE